MDKYLRSLIKFGSTKYVVCSMVFVAILTTHYLLPTTVQAHEAYVLPKADFERGLVSPGVDLLAVLQNAADFSIFIRVSLGVLGLLILNFLFKQSRFGQKTDEYFYRLQKYGPLITRLTLSVSLFFSALSLSFLGPELSISMLFFHTGLQALLFICSGLFLIGYLTEIAAVICLTIFLLLMFQFGFYQFTYLNYLGEFIVLALFGSRTFSLDQKLFGPLKRFKKYQEYETTIVRIFYGAALTFAAVTIKILHPQLSVEVVNNYNLTQFTWLFPKDPWLVALVAVLSEITIGIFIIIGFELRLTILISLFYITLSLIYFREAVWPHLLLYGISINLLAAPPKFSVDEYLAKNKKWLKEKLVFP
jgi:uncharacterized membrane protein YphA (DoxX/SURF4 family)